MLPEPLQQPVTFEHEKIELDIEKVKEFQSGWRVELMTTPTVSIARIPHPPCSISFSQAKLH